MVYGIIIRRADSKNQNGIESGNMETFWLYYVFIIHTQIFCLFRFYLEIKFQIN